MSEHHSPDIYGPIALAGDPGVAGQKIQSAGPGAQAVWATDAAAPTLAVTDTATVDHTLTAGPNYNLSSTVKVSANAGNEVQVLADGLFVAPSPGMFTFTSALSLNHVILHNLNNSFPVFTIYDQANGNAIDPSQVTSSGPNQLNVSFFVARAIAGTVIG